MTPAREPSCRHTFPGGWRPDMTAYNPLHLPSSQKMLFLDAETRGRPVEKDKLG